MLSMMASGSASYNIIRLDKGCPAAPTSLAATVTSGSVALTWTAGGATEEVMMCNASLPTEIM